MEQVQFNVPLVVWDKAQVGGTPKAPVSFGAKWLPLVTAEQRKKGRGFFMAVAATPEHAAAMRNELARLFTGRSGTQGDEYQTRTACGEIADRITAALGDAGSTVRQELRQQKEPTEKPAPKVKLRDLGTELVPSKGKVALGGLGAGTVFFLPLVQTFGPDVLAGKVEVTPLRFVNAGWRKGVVKRQGESSTSVAFETYNQRTFTPDTGPNAGKEITVVQTETGPQSYPSSLAVHPAVTPDHPDAVEDA
jgi:hypothetical protein